MSERWVQATMSDSPKSPIWINMAQVVFMRDFRDGSGCEIKVASDQIVVVNELAAHFMP